MDGAFLDRTAQLFEQRTGRKLNREDARQIVENVTGFFRLLAEWQNMESARRFASLRRRWS
ncbi:hypothetical protein NKH81_15245 [Mesorhizobium sp. M0959]|uniref:hypothetical protein n=1 Tax=Mesorhizobium sp. M0959 TaxID=2957034 RepID=UPI00333BB154